MDSIRVERLRCLSDTGDIKIKPLTVLLGQNSSGKSSFLRVFPLLKQSIESRTTGPILWSGDLVDFGSFHDAHKKNSDNNIAFSFKFKLINLSNNLINICLTIQVTEHKEKQTTRTSKIDLKFEDSQIELEFDENQCVTRFYVNSLNILDFGYKYSVQKIYSHSLLPIINEETDENLYNKSNNLFLIFVNSESFTGLFNALTKHINKYLLPTNEPTIIYQFFQSFAGLNSSENLLKHIQNNNFFAKYWKQETRQWTIETEDFKQLRDLIIANAIPIILKNCDDTLTNLSQQMSYIGPVRATAERSYPHQDLADDQVDHQGKNLAIFLRNLTDKQRKTFSEWTLENFGFEPSIQTSLGNISLLIKSKNFNEYLNIADTGFGFSQVLPIITQLWLLSVFPKSKTQLIPNSLNAETGIVTYAIEQPELHLHPRLQGTLTDAFVTAINTAKNNDIDLRLVIETHSEVLVNRLGHLVAEKKISPDDINIVLFEPSEESGEIQVRTSQFDAEGYLENWPLGFFEMELV